MNTPHNPPDQNPPEFDLQEHLDPYLPRLLEIGISPENAKSHLMYTSTLAAFQNNIQILLEADVLPPLSESGDDMLNEALRSVSPFRL